MVVMLLQILLIRHIFRVLGGKMCLCYYDYVGLLDHRGAPYSCYSAVACMSISYGGAAVCQRNVETIHQCKSSILAKAKLILKLDKTLTQIILCIS